MNRTDKKGNSGNQSRIRLYQAIAIVSVFVIFFLVSELFVRVSGFASPNHLMFFDKTLVKGKPFARYINWKEGRNPVELNNWGFHDRNRDITNDNYRILFLGDSFVDASRVPVDNLFTSLLEEKFQREGSPLEIINAGFGGVGTVYEYLLWKKFFYKKIKVDHIVVCIFTANDLQDNNPLPFHGPSNHMLYLDSMGNVYVKTIEYSLPQSIARRLTDYSALVNTVYKRLHYLKCFYVKRKIEAARTIQSKNQADLAGGGSFPVSAWNDSVNGTICLIGRWNKELSSEGIKLSIVLVNSADFYLRGGYENKFQEGFVTKLKKLCLKDKIQILELNFADYDPYKIYSFDGVMLGHLNYTGHRLAADQIFSWLKKNISLKRIRKIQKY